MKIVRESKSESFRIPPQNENCQRVQIQEFQNTPPKWKLSESPNPRVSEYPSKLSEISNPRVLESPPKWKLSESPNLRVSEYPPVKIVRESKSESFRIPRQNENCQRVQIREFQNTPPKLSEIPNPRVSEYPPQWKLSESPNPRVSEYPPSPRVVKFWSKFLRIPLFCSTEYPPKWKLSESPNPRVSEYPPKMKTVRESKSKSFRIPPQNENCQRVQIREFQNTPPNCQRFQIREF